MEDFKSGKILIVSKTKMSNGFCVGGININTCESIRIHNNKGGNLDLDTPYEIGDIWEMSYKTAWNVRKKPHIEDKQTFPYQKIENIGISGIIEFINSHSLELGERLISSNIYDIFEGKIILGTNKNYIDQSNIPNFSTQFWISDKDLTLTSKFEKNYYSYNDIQIKYVGIEKTLNIIPAGTIIRLSLANWWDGDGSGQSRCYLQLSGWYFDKKAYLLEKEKKLKEIKDLVFTKKLNKSKYDDSYYCYIDDNTIVKIMQDAMEPWEKEDIEVIKIEELKYNKTTIKISRSEKILYDEQS